MHSRNKKLVSFFAAVLLCFGRDRLVAQNLLLNGSFETPITSTILTLHVGDTNLAGWSIGGAGSIYVVTTPLPQLTNAVHGSQFVDFNGANGGVTLSQTFATEAGEVYDVAFSIGQYQAPQLTFTVEAAVIDAGNTVLTNREVVAPQTLGWLSPTKLRFIATTSTTTLCFTNTNGTSNVDLMLDAVSVRRVAPRLAIESSPVRLCWQTDTNYLYQIQSLPSLSSSAWNDFGEAIPGTGDTYCAGLPTNVPSGFFRVLVLPRPQ